MAFQTLKQILGTFGALTFLLAATNSCISAANKRNLESIPSDKINPSSALSQPHSELPDYVKALQFDQWLKRTATADKMKDFEAQCSKNPGLSPFCYSVNHFEKLERQRKNHKSISRKKTRSKRVKALFKKEEITNWIELRFSPVMATLSPLKSLKTNEIALLQVAALKETSCPNNIAVSLAAYLEDDLPLKASYQTIGELYQKGAQCPPDNPGDSETLMTRAGLMFLAANNLQSAELCFKKSAADPHAFRSRALYWLYKIYQDGQRKKLAEETLTELKNQYPFSFHTLMALNGAKQDPGAILKKPAPGLLTRSEQAPQLNNLIEQVEILNNHGFSQSADRVLSWILSDSEQAEPEFMIYVSDLNHSQGNYLNQLRILTNVLYGNPTLSSKAVLERYFPKLYFPVFEKHSGGLDPYLLMSIARRESAFNTKAVSVARAKGLMQISPGTHRRLSSQKKSIFDPEHNISIGSRYLADLIKKSDGSIHLALAGYNAGPKRVDIWTARYPSSDPVLFIDLIPYKETREYVASVLRNYYWYRRLHAEEESTSLSSLLNP